MLKPNPNITQQFLQAMALSKDERITFQTFDDSEEKRSSLARIIHGTFYHCAQRLISLNKRGAGVFWTVNRTDLRGRKAQNIVAVRALFVDLDGAPLEPVQNCAEPPDVIVESSPGRYHCYWLVSDCPLEDFGPVQKGLIKKFNADPACFDLPRVMRLPGFVHQKKEPFRSVCIHVTSTI